MKKFLKRTLSVFLTIVMLFTAAPLSGFVGIDLSNFSNIFSTKVEAESSYFTKVWSSKISATNAQINADLSKVLNISSSGFYIGTSTTNMKKVKENNGGDVNKIWYDMNKWYGKLKPLTKYYYQLYIVVSGKEYVTDVRSFTTEIFSKVWSDNITKTNAQINANLTGFELDSSGFYIGLSKSDMEKVKENKGGFVEKIWYDMNKWYGKLTQGTTYYYKLFVVISGVEYATEVKSFTTLTKQPINTVKLNKTSTSIVKGSSLQLTATVTPSDADNKNVTWSSSNTSVATVDSKGKVTAKAVGNATITVKTKDGNKTATCKVTVTNGTINVTGVSLNKTKLTLYVGKTQTLSATVKPKNATNKALIWSSSNTSVAKVDSNGKITAVAKGSATITAKTKDGNKTAICTVTINPYNENISKGATFTTDKNGKADIKFDANWLQSSSYDYNHELAKFCSLISMLTYSETPEINKTLKNLGFKGFDSIPSEKECEKVVYNTNDDMCIYWPSKEYTNKQRDRNCFIITQKDYIINGDQETVVLVLLRGSFGYEWYSNFDCGTGNIHKSFLAAAKFVYKHLDDYLSNNSLLDKDNVKLIITGHSRGAGVANLLGWYIQCAEYYSVGGESGLVSGNYKQSYPKEENIYTYTFATPNVAKKYQLTTACLTGTGKSLKNIFNFVNPEDFVTKCMPAAWNYGRYGVTLTLPSKTNESNRSFKTYYNNMNVLFKQYFKSNYTNYSNGESTVYNVVQSITRKVANASKYYSPKFTCIAKKQSLYDFFYDYFCPLAVKGFENITTIDKLPIGTVLCSPLSDKMFKDIVTFFKDNAKEFEHAHCSQTYAAYVNSMSYDQAYTWATAKYRAPKKGTVNCPVDVEVYDVDTGELVGRIVDNKVDEEVASGENAIVMSVDGDSKMYWLPSNGNYEVKLTGNANGIMNHTVSQIDEEQGEIGRVNFEDVAVSEGFEMYSEYIQDETEVENISLITELGETINYTECITDLEENSVLVATTVEGIGNVADELSVVKGDYVSLLAETDENNSFIGWYVNGELVSRDKEYSFVAKENINLVAKFTNVIVDVTDVDINKEVVNLHITGDKSFEWLIYNVLPRNSTDKSVKWSSSDESIVRVDEFGIVEAVGFGTAQITAITIDGGYVDSCTVNVVPREFTITWNVNGAENVQNVLEGTAINTPEEPQIKGFTFMSWDSEIPLIMPDCNLYFTAQFVPFAGRVNSVSINDISMNYKGSATIVPEINADSGVNYTVTYSSSDTDVAYVDENGNVYAAGDGTAEITCTVTDEYGNVVTDTCEVKVSYAWWQWIIRILLLGFLWY